MESMVPPIPFMNNPEETAEIKRLRELVEDGLGKSDFELVGLKQDSEGNLIGVFRRRQH